MAKAERSSPAGVKRSATAGRKTSRASATGQNARLQQPKQPTGTPSGVRAPQPATRQSPGRHDILETAVQAAAELAEIGLTVSARALRSALSRFPRP